MSTTQNSGNLLSKASRNMGKQMAQKMATTAYNKLFANTKNVNKSRPSDDYVPKTTNFTPINQVQVNKTRPSDDTPIYSTNPYENNVETENTKTEGRPTERDTRSLQARVNDAQKAPPLVDPEAEKTLGPKTLELINQQSGGLKNRPEDERGGLGNVNENYPYQFSPNSFEDQNSLLSNADIYTPEQTIIIQNSSEKDVSISFPYLAIVFATLEYLISMAIILLALAMEATVVLMPVGTPLLFIMTTWKVIWGIITFYLTMLYEKRELGKLKLNKNNLKKTAAMIRKVRTLKVIMAGTGVAPVADAFIPSEIIMWFASYTAVKKAARNAKA